MQVHFLSPYIGTLTAFQTLGALAEGQLRAQYAISKTLIDMVSFPASPPPAPLAKAPAAKPKATAKATPKPKSKTKPARKTAPAKTVNKPAAAHPLATPTPAGKRPRAPSTPPSMPAKAAKKSN